jgi:hypothetical protein
VHMRQSTTILYDNIPPMHFSASRFGHRFIIYQTTRDKNIREKYRNVKEYRSGELLGCETILHNHKTKV